MFRYLASAEKVTVVLLIGVTVLILSAATFIVFKRLARLWTHAPAPNYSRRVKWVHRAVLVMAAVLVVCGAYSFWEPYRLEVTKVTVPTPKLLAGARPIRIVHISDTHCEGRPLLEDRVVDVIAGLQPDVICFTGDCINHPSGLPRFRRLMTQLDRIAPTFAVYGNWDWNAWRGRENYFAGTGVQVVDRRPIRVLVDNQPLWVTGFGFFDDDVALNVSLALADVPPDEPVVFLHHMPSVVLDLPERGVDLCLTGHTHGGQVVLPFYGPIVTLTPTGRRFWAGLYRYEDTYMYVNRGLGVEGHWLPRIRFLARPELTLIQLTPQSVLTGP